MSRHSANRRQFIQSAAGLAAAANLPFWFTERASADESKNDRPIFGCIGLGGQGTGIARRAKDAGADVVAICDVYRPAIEKARAENFEKAELYEDYRKLLDRKDVEAVTIGTPDHWHTAIALAALDAGKHVYCEKPLTLTIDEGKQLVAAVKRTGKKFQVGTQQRGDQIDLFGRAVATVRSGQLGPITKVTVQLPAAGLEGGPFAAQPVPDGLNWDFWQGQAPVHDYCPQRCRHEFRWWWDYSGGMLCDWGAHHIDIAQWALDKEHTGPVSLDGSKTVLPKIPGGYETPKIPLVDCEYADGIKLEIMAQHDNGILFEGANGRLFVNRGRINGTPVEAQDADPALLEKTMELARSFFKGNLAKNHMENFFQAFKHDLPTISDVESQHRSVSVSHLGNISIRLGRKIQWDPDKQEIVGDPDANAMLKRPQRAPYQFSPSV